MGPQAYAGLVPMLRGVGDTLLVLDAICKVHPNGFRAVDQLSLDVSTGEFVCLIGPSGCGKTTTLEMINRLVEPTEGKILFNGQDTARMAPELLRREIGYVIQQTGLFPHMTIEQNIAVVMNLKGWKKGRQAERVTELLELVGLDPEVYRRRYPKELSGGQQQRIGVLRALAAEPDLILMDEPFGALDPITRSHLQEELKKLQQRLRKTVVFVTHDMGEAVKLADRVVFMRSGKIVQAAPPADILRNPRDDFVRDFVGRGA
jgi:osmoprotectant transport system ATP-binding protein